MNKYQIGQQIPVCGIITITGFMPNKQGNPVYNTNRGLAVPEALIEWLEMKPLEKAQTAEEPPAITPPEAPAEDKPRFKVGDKVKIVRSRMEHKAKYVGEICEINELYPNGKNAWQEPNYGTSNSYVWFEDELEPYTDPAPAEKPLTVTRKMLEKLGACSDGLREFDEKFPSGTGEFVDVCEAATPANESWLARRQDKIAAMQDEKAEAVKLYCVEVRRVK